MPRIPKPKPARNLSKDLVTCPKCQGKGKIPNPATIGDQLRKMRLKAKVAQGVVAERMRKANVAMSTSYLSDLEQGRRDFSLEQIEAYKAALAIGQPAK